MPCDPKPFEKNLNPDEIKKGSLVVVSNDKCAYLNECIYFGTFVEYEHYRYKVILYASALPQHFKYCRELPEDFKLLNFMIGDKVEYAYSMNGAFHGTGVFVKYNLNLLFPYTIFELEKGSIHTINEDGILKINDVEFKNNRSIINPASIARSILPKSSGILY